MACYKKISILFPLFRLPRILNLMLWSGCQKNAKLEYYVLSSGWTFHFLFVGCHMPQLPFVTYLAKNSQQLLLLCHLWQLRVQFVGIQFYTLLWTDRYIFIIQKYSFCKTVTVLKTNCCKKSIMQLLAPVIDNPLVFVQFEFRQCFSAYCTITH